ncbi:MAG: hypothetical protein CK431_09990 [Mycobacterium sp.]|nr:MAG: hypothetical protein CK431_09990 [Mycobacterium sp.]
MALMYRAELEPNMENMFQRRVAWESAIVSYGRLIVSDNKRKIPFKELVQDVAGDDGLAIHEKIMDWRQGHVVHRTRAEFESVETVLAFEDGSATPTALKIVVGVDLGPLDDSPFVVAFRQHVKNMRDAIAETILLPLGKGVIGDLNSGRIAQPQTLRPADDQSSRERYVITYSLAKLAPTDPVDQPGSGD